MKKKAIIVDIDGTLADVSNITYLLKKDPPNWDEWAQATKKCSSNKWCEELIDAMYIRGFDILFVTGRNNKYRDLTKKWLNQHINVRDYKLIMRPNDDFRGDELVKEYLYHNEVKKNYDILFVVDDRKRVVDAWRKLGLTCLACAEGNY